MKTYINIESNRVNQEVAMKAIGMMGHVLAFEDPIAISAYEYKRDADGGGSFTICVDFPPKIPPVVAVQPDPSDTGSAALN